MLSICPPCCTSRSSSSQYDYVKRSFPRLDMTSDDFDLAVHRKHLMDLVVILARIHYQPEWAEAQDLLTFK